MRSAGSRLVVLAALCAVVAFIIWKSVDRQKPPLFQSDAAQHFTPAPEPATPAPPPATPKPTVADAAPPTPAPPVLMPARPSTPVPPRIAARMALAATMPAAPAGPTPIDEEIQAHLTNVQSTVRDYYYALDGNPVGTNAEITKALLGGNPKGTRFPIPTGSTVNNNGELCDRWGTPYFFHQVSKTKMEVRSAGADRAMWTTDDIQR